MNFFDKWNNFLGDMNQYWSFNAKAGDDYYAYNYEALPAIDGIFGTDDSDDEEPDFRNAYSTDDSARDEECHEYAPDSILERINGLILEMAEIQDDIDFLRTCHANQQKEISDLENQWNTPPYHKK